VEASTPPSDSDLVQMALAGSRVKAIKLYGGIHGVDLPSAKEALDTLVRNYRPELSAAELENLYRSGHLA
jgi:ribosomal protein L7/L12